MQKQFEVAGPVELDVRLVAGEIEIDATLEGRVEIELIGHDEESAAIVEEARVELRDHASPKVVIDVPQRKSGFGFGFIFGRQGVTLPSALSGALCAHRAHEVGRRQRTRRHRQRQHRHGFGRHRAGDGRRQRRREERQRRRHRPRGLRCGQRTDGVRRRLDRHCARRRERVVGIRRRRDWRRVRECRRQHRERRPTASRSRTGQRRRPLGLR